MDRAFRRNQRRVPVGTHHPSECSSGRESMDTMHRENPSACPPAVRVVSQLGVRDLEPCCCDLRTATLPNTMQRFVPSPHREHQGLMSYPAAPNDAHVHQAPATIGLDMFFWRCQGFPAQQCLDGSSVNPKAIMGPTYGATGAPWPVPLGLECQRQTNKRLQRRGRHQQQRDGGSCRV